MDTKKFTTKQIEPFLTQIEPNPWNPNIQEDAIFNSLKKSIKENGFTCPILIRELGEGKFQIIDGEHRYKACTALGYVKIKAENIGVISDSIAKILTIALNNIRGQDDILKRAEILKALNEGQRSMFPWSEETMKNELALLDFDWDKFNNVELEDMSKQKKDNTACFSLTEAQQVLLKECINFTKKKDESEALVDILIEYASLRIDIQRYGTLVDKNRK